MPCNPSVTARRPFGTVASTEGRTPSGEELRLRKAVIPGSFDPVTLGHLDVVERAAKLFDDVVVAILVNDAKAPLFSIEDRIEMMRASLTDQTNVAVTSFSGLLVDFCTAQGADAVVKGLRSAADAELEMQMAHMNRHLSGVETILLSTSAGLSFVSSSLVKEIARMGGDISGLVTPYVQERLQELARNE
jgi:pantetheine-phosphate adenylyltransferase